MGLIKLFAKMIGVITIAAGLVTGCATSNSEADRAQVDRALSLYKQCIDSGGSPLSCEQYWQQRNNALGGAPRPTSNDPSNMINALRESVDVPKTSKSQVISNKTSWQTGKVTENNNDETVADKKTQVSEKNRNLREIGIQDIGKNLHGIWISGSDCLNSKTETLISFLPKRDSGLRVDVFGRTSGDYASHMLVQPTRDSIEDKQPLNRNTGIAFKHLIGRQIDSVYIDEKSQRFKFELVSNSAEVDQNNKGRRVFYINFEKDKIHIVSQPEEVGLISKDNAFFTSSMRMPYVKCEPLVRILEINNFEPSKYTNTPFTNLGNQFLRDALSKINEEGDARSKVDVPITRPNLQHSKGTQDNKDDKSPVARLAPPKIIVTDEKNVNFEIAENDNCIYASNSSICLSPALSRLVNSDNRYDIRGVKLSGKTTLDDSFSCAPYIIDRLNGTQKVSISCFDQTAKLSLSYEIDWASLFYRLSGISYVTCSPRHVRSGGELHRELEKKYGKSEPQRDVAVKSDLIANDSFEFRNYKTGEELTVTFDEQKSVHKDVFSTLNCGAGQIMKMSIANRYEQPFLEYRLKKSLEASRTSNIKPKF